MPDTLSVPPPPGLASVPNTPTSTSTDNNNNNNNNSKNNNRPRRQESSSSVTHLSPTFPAHHHAQASTTAQLSPSSSHSSSPSPSSHTSTALTTGATAGERGTETGTAVAVRMDASPIILFTLQYSVAVVQGVTIYILSVVFSILQLVSGQLNDSPPSSRSTNSGSGARKKGVRSGDEGLLQQRRQQQRRRRWSGSGSGSGTTSPTLSTSGVSWAQNLIAHTQQTQAQSQLLPVETNINAPTGGEGGGAGVGGTLAQRVEALQFLGSTIANLVGTYARLTTSSSAFSSTGEDIGSVPQKRHLASSISTGAGGTEAGGQGGVEMSYSSRIRRALVKTLSGHAIPLPRSMKRVTFNDTLQFHTTTTNRRPRACFGDEDEEEDDDEDEEDEGSSPVLRFFSGGFGAGVSLSPEEPMSTSPTPSVPLLVPGGGKKVKKNRPPSIMPPARDRRQLQEQDDLEDMAAAVQETGARSSGFSVVSNGRSIPVSTTTMTPEFSNTMGKTLVSTITIALPPLSRPRKQLQQQPHTPTSPVMTIAAMSTTTASGSATTTTTTTSMTPTNYSLTNGTSGLASALLSSLMMPASSGPISDVARSLLSPSTLESSAPVLSDSDSSKSSSGGGGRVSLKRTRSAPSKISTFFQQHRLARQQQQQQGRGQMIQGLFSAGEYTSSLRDVSSPLPSATVVAAKAKVATETESTAPSSSTASVDSATASSTTTASAVRARQPSTSSTMTLIRPRSPYSVQSTVSSAVAAVIGGEPPPSVPISLTTSMSRSLSPRLEPIAFSPTAVAFSPTTTTTMMFSPTHQRNRSASVDLTNVRSLRLPSSSSTDPGPGNALEPATPTSSGSGGRSLMYKLTHPQRYKRELELQLQAQHQKDTNSLSSATSSPSASQVALTLLSPTGSTTSIQGTLKQETASASAMVTATATRMMYPFSRSFTDLPASLSYLSDEPHPAHLPPPHSYSSMSVESSSSPTSAFVATSEIHQPLPQPLTPPPSDKDMIAAAAVRESSTPPLSMFFPSPTTQHRAALASLPSPALSSSSSSPTTTNATAMLSSMKDSLAQLRRSPSPGPRSMAEDDEDGAGSHTTFAACGFSLASSSSY